MSSEQVSAVLRYIRSLAVARDDELVPDRQLLDRFAAGRDQSAYTCLLKRHGPMVLSVCRGVLHDAHDAEDAFQATFVILAEKAGSIHRQEAVASWLYRVAYHVAVKARANAARRRIQEGLAFTTTAADPLLDMNLRELRDVLHGELQRLPEKYRAPLVLCYLEEKTQEEAARLLGWPKGVVKGRLERGRDHLRARLARRRLELSLGLLVTALAPQSASATVPAILVDSTLKAGLAVAAGKASAGAISVEVAALVREATRSWFMSNIKAITLLVLATGLAIAGTGMLVWREPTVQPAPQTQADSPKSKDQKRQLPPSALEKQARVDRYGDPLPDGAIARVGTVRFRHGSQVYCLAFSPDGSLIASGSFHGDLCLWDRATGKLVCRFVEPVQDDRIRFFSAVTFSPDGQILASNRGKAALWEIRSGKLLRDLDESIFGHVCSMAFSHDSKALALGTKKGIWLYDLTTGQSRRAIPEYSAIVTAVVFSKDGKVLASASIENSTEFWTARIWN